MADKSGGDVAQMNGAMQGNLSSQGLNSIATGGVGAVGSMGGMAASLGSAIQYVDQDQSQGNIAHTGDGGSDNTHADTTISV